jgi:cob(I)alamin adenosyltransferase
MGSYVWFETGDDTPRRAAKEFAMPKRTRIYTRTGDDGTTGLVGGQRVRKDALRIETYGTIDELSASIGLARAALAQTPPPDETIKNLDAELARAQDLLFTIGSELATLPDDHRAGMPHVSASDTSALEHAIDAAQQDLPPLANFILPGGSYPGAFLHQARTIARRAERLLVALNATEPLAQETLRYMNRLSDALFVWSRRINHLLGQPEHLWNPRPP